MCGRLLDLEGANQSSKNTFEDKHLISWHVLLLLLLPIRVRLGYRTLTPQATPTDRQIWDRHHGSPTLKMQSAPRGIACSQEASTKLIRIVSRCCRGRIFLGQVTNRHSQRGAIHGGSRGAPVTSTLHSPWMGTKNHPTPMRLYATPLFHGSDDVR